MALIKCPDCGKEVSDRTKTCIHCGCPIASDEDNVGKVIIKEQNNPCDYTRKQLTFDICSTDGKKLCTIEPGTVKRIEIHRDMEILAIPTYGVKSAKQKRKTNSIKISSNKETRVHLAFVRVAWGLDIKAVLNEVDVIDSD
ncbi:MAG: zinc ribbon domain-containing protein [Ruminococcaceae bacterium]|nr:zinc ribbon domain-containing protein [Oscillospiraceae bacterium]